MLLLVEDQNTREGSVQQDYIRENHHNMDSMVWTYGVTSERSWRLEGD